MENGDGLRWVSVQTLPIWDDSLLVREVLPSLRSEIRAPGKMSETRGVGPIFGTSPTESMRYDHFSVRVSAL